MQLLPKLALIAWVSCASVWAQSGSSPDSSAKPVDQASQSYEPAPDSGKESTEATPPPNPGNSTKLEPIKIEKAIYPLEAQAKQLQGQVWVKISVSESGDVENVEVISGDPTLSEAAVHAARKWKFKPFIKNGKAVKVAANLPFDFAFEGNINVEKVPPADGSTVTAVVPVAGEAPKRVRVSAGVTTGLLVYKVQPVYPPDARQARIQGVVLLKAIISKEGRIKDLQLITGPKELAGAAIGAVQQWRYQPYLLMGNPVEVETQIQVNFQLR